MRSPLNVFGTSLGNLTLQLASLTLGILGTVVSAASLVLGVDVLRCVAVPVSD